jgi:outer membrane protein assembly factor BamE (lipoprotein component of BamABCDE complex)
MMTNRFVYVVTAIVAAFLLTGCQTAQKSGSTASTAPTSATPSAKAESPKDTGDTQTVKGINDWEGEITGKPAPGSKFTRLKIGMSMKQVTDLIGQPSDQGAYVTGKAWIPFYFGSDRYRHEMVYKGQGRLIFAGGSRGDYSSGNLISIIHNAQEGGYR